MGQTGSKNKKLAIPPIMNEPIEPVPVDNGYFLCDIFIPEEILILILSYVDGKTLNNNCTLVCQKWLEIINDEAWRIKAEREFSARFKNIKKYKRFPSTVYRSICLKDSFGRNLIVNSSGTDKFNYWKVTENGGDKWKIENPPQGVPHVDNPLFEPRQCFVTSYHPCSKKQVINLYKEGLTQEIIDNYKPHITVSEWYTARWDCSSKYQLQVELQDDQNKVIKAHSLVAVMKNWTEGWKKEEHTFEEYGPGVKYVCFFHLGVDEQFWAGHYGSKMAGASVTVVLDSIKDLNED